MQDAKLGSAAGFGGGDAKDEDCSSLKVCLVFGV